jgi:hypothetical protein
VAWAGFRFRKLPVSSGAAQLEPSQRVRVQGVVEGASVTRAEFSGVAAVVSRHELGNGAAARWSAASPRTTSTCAWKTAAACG